MFNGMALPHMSSLEMPIGGGQLDYSSLASFT